MSMTDLDWLLITTGVQENKYPFLGSFLRTSNNAASGAIRGDVESACTDPKRWLNPAGHDLLFGLPGFDQHNASMLWGTYRPGVYFGERTGSHMRMIVAGRVCSQGSVNLTGCLQSVLPVLLDS